MSSNLLINYWFLVAFWVVVGSTLILTMALKRYFYLSSFFVVVVTTLAITHEITSLYEPYHGLPSKNSTYIHHTVRHEDGGTIVYLWVMTDGRDGLYVFPYDEDTGRALREAAIRSKTGIETILKKQAGRIENSSAEYHLHGDPVLPESLPPKD